MRKKIALILVICFALVTFVGCGPDVAGLEARIRQLEESATVFYDWDNPIVMSTDEFAKAILAKSFSFDALLARYNNKVVQVTGEVTSGIVFGGVSNAVGLNYELTCNFSQKIITGDLFHQQVTIVGVAAGGYTYDGFFFCLYWCKLV